MEEFVETYLREEEARRVFIQLCNAAQVGHWDDVSIHFIDTHVGWRVLAKRDAPA